MKRGLFVGIDDYPGMPLVGCADDASRLRTLLARNEDGSPNFDTKLLISPAEVVTRPILRAQLDELFSSKADVALFYFSGHGAVTKRGGIIVTTDVEQNDEGITMEELVSRANDSMVSEAIIFLDCCFSGAAGEAAMLKADTAVLREGVSILSASRKSQVSMATTEGSIFTNLVRAALTGGAADVVGRVTVASVYAYVDQTLGSWEQRPVFKSHVARLTPLRQCKPWVDLDVLRKLPAYFPSEGFEFPLDPSYEPDAPPPHAEHEAVFKDLQRLRDARLLCPVGEDHLYYAAIRSKRCKLTALGEFYRDLAMRGRL